MCCYLVGTQDYSLIYKEKIGLRVSAYTDLDWASNPKDNRLQSGYFFIIVDSIFS